MNIALMTDDKKQELMTQFCIAYCGILAKHTLCATNTTGNIIKEATGLDISLFLSHEHGGCLAPVNYLADRGVTVLLAGGMGMRPLMGFLQEGVDVYYAAGIETVEKAVAAHIAGELPRFSPNHSCGGGHH